MFTGKKDTDLSILEKLDDRSLFNFCISVKSNKEGYKLCHNEDFWRKRTLDKFPELIQFKNSHRKGTWRNFYVSQVNTIDIIQRKYNIPYFVSNTYNPRKILEIEENETDEYQRMQKIISYVFNAAVSAKDRKMLRFLEKHFPQIGEEMVTREAAINVGRENNLEMVKYIDSLMGDTGVAYMMQGALEDPQGGSHISLIKHLVNKYDANSKQILDWSITEPNISLFLLSFELGATPSITHLEFLRQIQTGKESDVLFGLLLKTLVSQHNITLGEIEETELFSKNNLYRMERLEEAKRIL
jgi:hypothetical protein